MNTESEDGSGVKQDARREGRRGGRGRRERQKR